MSRIQPVYANVVRELRAEGIELSDRRVVKGMKLIAAAALVREATVANAQDLWPLNHFWSRPEEAEAAKTVVQPRVAEAGGPALELTRPVTDILDDIAVLEAQDPMVRSEIIAMSVPNPHVRFHYEDYKTLPETLSPRYELLDGALLMVPAPTPFHQHISRNLAFLLLQFVRQHRLGVVFYSPIDVVLGSGDDREIVQPDLLFLDNSQRRFITAEEIRGAPALVVEILSPGTATRDRGYKKILYGRYGVREYWLVDPAAQTIEVYTPGTKGLALAWQYARTGILKSLVLPGLAIPLEQIFRED